MKTIIISESQFNRLFETHLDFNDGGVPDYIDGGEVTVSNNVTDSDGEPQIGKQPTTDEFADTQSVQNYWANGARGGRYNK